MDVQKVWNADMNVAFKGKKRLTAPAMISARNMYHFDLRNHRFST